MMLSLLLASIALSMVQAVQVCLFGGHQAAVRASTPRLDRPRFNYTYSDLKAWLGGSRRSFHLALRYHAQQHELSVESRSIPFRASLLREGHVYDVSGVVNGEQAVQNRDMVFLRIPEPGNEEVEWGNFEETVIEFYNAMHIFMLDPEEEVLLRRVIRRSSAILIAKVVCFDNVDLGATSSESNGREEDSRR